MPPERQLAFSTPADDAGNDEVGILSSSDITTSDTVVKRGAATTPRRVLFAVQNAAPSPPLRPSRLQFLSGTDDVHQPQRNSVALRTLHAPPKPQKRSSDTQTRQKQEKTHPVARKPAWDADVKHAPAFFDATIAKTALFQPRPGDRRQEMAKEAKELSDRQPLKQPPTASVHSTRTTKAVHASPQWNRRRMNAKPASYRHAKSSIPTAAPVQLPSRPTKDFVRLNFEQVAGRSFAKPPRQATVPSKRVNVFKRLSKPFVAASPGRVAQFADNRDESLSQPSNTTGRAASDATKVHPITLPVLTSPPVTLNGQDAAVSPVAPGSSRFADVETSPILSIRVDSPAPRPSPNQESSPRLSPKSSRSPPSRSPRSPQSRSHAQPSYSANVFAVLDRQQRGRIGVNQILDGLRLLGLPATHNQVGCSVALRVVGDTDSRCALTPHALDACARYPTTLEEWEILVGTLDAASQPTSLSLSPPPSHFEKSEQIVEAATSPGFLEGVTDAWLAAPVQSARSQGRQVRTPLRSTPSTDTKHLDALASAILDDLLLVRPCSCVSTLSLPSEPRMVTASVGGCVCGHQDTAELLNDEELRVTQHQADLDHASQLDAILEQIKEVEDHENQLIQQGLAMEYAVPNQLRFSSLDQPAFSNTSQQPTTTSVADQRDNSSAIDVPLVLPLGVVLQLDVPEQQAQECATSRITLDTKPASSPAPNIEALTHVRVLTLKRTGQSRALSMSVLHGRRYLSIEKRRQQFERHRRLVEASLAGTGMEQWAVIEVYVCSFVRSLALAATKADVASFPVGGDDPGRPVGRHSDGLGHQCRVTYRHSRDYSDLALPVHSSSSAFKKLCAPSVAVAFQPPVQSLGASRCELGSPASGSAPRPLCTRVESERRQRRPERPD
ncbi:hypothetical protein PybrP1_003737, partial [[Pythium] brassicae (nom. inval.)]